MQIARTFWGMLLNTRKSQILANVVWSTFGFIVLTTMLMSWALLFPFAVVDKMFTDVKLLQQPHIYFISIFGFTVKTFFPRWISAYFSSKSWFLEDDFSFPSTGLYNLIYLCIYIYFFFIYLHIYFNVYIYIFIYIYILMCIYIGASRNSENNDVHALAAPSWMAIFIRS
jgi:hypothetical protein